MNDPTPPRMTDQAPELLREALKSVSAQCGNVIYNCEQRPADNERHLNSWKGVKEFVDAALTRPTPAERPVPQEDRCPTCERTATEFRGYQPERCRDPWHKTDPQVREALELEIEKWDTDERVTYPDHEVLESLDRILDALTARPSDAAVAWQQTLLECRDFLADLVSGASFEGRAINHAKELIEEADALLALPPDEPARVNELRSQLDKARAALETVAIFIKDDPIGAAVVDVKTMQCLETFVRAAFTDEQGGK